MTGADVLRQVREALDRNSRARWNPILAIAARTALDGCVVLSREEAEKVLNSLDPRHRRLLLALLTPEEKP